jgi:hypothetical protein
LIQQLFGSITASVGNLNATGEAEKQYSFFKALNLANFWMYSWAALGVVFVSSDLVTLCFGSKYILPIRIPIILAVNLYMVGMQNAIWTFKNTKGLFKYGQYLLLVTAILNVIGDIVLGARFNVFGIYLATALARGITNTWYEPFALFKHGFEKSPIIYLKRYITYIVVLFVEAMICWVIIKFINFNLIVNIVLKTILCTLISNIMLYLVMGKSDEYIYIRLIINKVLKLININWVLKRKKFI